MPLLRFHNQFFFFFILDERNYYAEMHLTEKIYFINLKKPIKALIKSSLFFIIPFEFYLFKAVQI